MGNVVNINNPQNLDSEAIKWIVKLDGQRLSAEEFDRFRSWHDKSAAHAAAFRDAAATWGNLDILSELRLLRPANQNAPWWRTVPRRLTETIGRHMRRPQFAAAALLILAIAGAGYFIHQPRERAPDVYNTAIGSHKVVALADGSSITLNTDSRIEILFSDDRRTVRLVKGEAHFDVAPDRSRPFEVHAGHNIVRAVGTAFTVELKPDLVEVNVTEGKVQLAALRRENVHDDNQAETPLALIRSGQSARFTDEIETIASFDSAEMDRRLAWRSGALVFRGEALEDVIREVSRYTTTEIIILDPEIRQLKIGGYYKTGETDAMLQALETSFGVSVQRVNPELVYLSGSSGR